MVGKVLSNGEKGWVYCPLDGEFDVAGFSTQWEACRYGVRASCDRVEYFEGGDGCSVYVSGSWLVFGNTEENAWMAAYKAAGNEICPDCNHPYLTPIGDESDTCEFCCNEVRAGKRSLENVCTHYADDTPQTYLSRNYY